MNARTDVLVIGAGPAGIAAAVRAREKSGTTVTVIDDNPETGGQIWRGGLHSGVASRWLQRLRDLEIAVVNGASVVSGDGKSRVILVETPEGPGEFRFERLVIATGAREAFLPFPGWTLPGVIGVGGLQALVKSGLPVADKRIVVAGSGPLLLAAAALFRKCGAHVCVIAEQASATALGSFVSRLLTMPEKFGQAVMLRASLAAVPYRTSCWVEAAEGHERVSTVRLRAGARTWVESCDYAAIGYGLVPNTELPALLGCKVAPDGVEVDNLQQTCAPGVYCAGECTGIGGVELSLIEGEIAGYAAAGEAVRAERLFPARRRARRFAHALNTAFQLRPELKQLAGATTIVCRCEDVTFARLGNFSSFHAAKLHTRCGMGPCQGRICGTATRVLFGWESGTIRPPVFPASITALALDGDSISEEAQAGS